MQQQAQQQQEIAASDDENRLLDTAASAALAPLADETPEVAQAVDQAVSAGGEMPERNLAMMAVALVDKGEKAVGRIDDPDMMEALASIVIWELVQMALAAGLDLSQTGVEPEEFAEVVLVEFGLLYAEAHPERLDDEDRAEVQALKATRAGQPPQPESPPGQQTPIARGVAAAAQPGRLSQSMGV